MPDESTGQLGADALGTFVLGGDIAEAVPGAPVVTGFDDCGTFLGATECEVRLYDADGNRKELQIADWIDTIEWEQTERGGCGVATINCLATWEELQLAGNERVDILLFGEPAYRGYVRRPEHTIADVERATLTCYGVMEILDRWIVHCKLAYPEPVDLSVVFTDLLNEMLTTSRQALLTVGIMLPQLSSTPIGVTVSSFDARGKGLGSALNQLCDIAPNSCIWGCGTSQYVDWRGRRPNVIYLRPRSTEVSAVYALGDNVSAYTYPPDSTRIVNRIRLTGGTVTQPNVLSVNPAFDEVAPPDTDVANFIHDPSFEVGGSWTDAAGASFKYVGEDATAQGGPRTGTFWTELDQNGEYITQTCSVRVEANLRLRVYARLENAIHANTFRMTIEGLDSGGGVVITATAILTPTDAIYRAFDITQDLTGYANVVKARVTITGLGGTASNDGVLIDDVSLVDVGRVGQTSWLPNTNGAAYMRDLVWDRSSSPAPALPGACYSVRMYALGVVNPATDYMEIYQPKSGYATVAPNEHYSMGVWYTTNGEDISGDVAFSFGVALYDSNYALISTIQSPTTTIDHTTDDGLWHFLRIGTNTGGVVDGINTPSNAAFAHAFFRLRAGGIIYVGPFIMVQGELPDTVTSGTDYWRGSTYEAVIDVEDADLTGLSTAAAASLTTYGDREETHSQEQVKDRDSLLIFASQYFNAHAVPQVSGSLSIDGPRDLLRHDLQFPLIGTVRLIGLPSAPAALYPTRARYSVGETVRMEADLGNDVADMTDLLVYSAARARQGF